MAIDFTDVVTPDPNDQQAQKYAPPQESTGSIDFSDVTIPEDKVQAYQQQTAPQTQPEQPAPMQAPAVPQPEPKGIWEKTKYYLSDQGPIFSSNAGGRAAAVAQGFNSGMQEFTTGITSLVAPEGTKAFRQAEDAKYYQDASKYPIATRAGYITGLLAPNVLLPGQSGATLGARAAQAAEQNAVLGALAYADNPTDRLKNTVMGAVIGPAAVGATGLASKAVQGIANKLNPTETSVAREVANDLGSLKDRAIANQEQAIAQGQSLTPAEASQSTRLIAKETRASVNPDEQIKLENFVNTREAKGKGAIRDFIDNIVSEGDAKATETKDKLYNAAKAVQLDPKQLQELKDNSQLTKIAEDALKHGQANHIITGEYRPGTIGYLDELKKSMDSMYSKEVKSGSDTYANMILQAKKDMLSVVDKASPDYAAAREIASRLIVKNQIQDAIKEIKSAPGEMPSVAKIYDNLASNEAKREALVKNISMNGGDPQQVRDFLTVVSKLNNKHIERMYTRDAASPADLRQGIATIGSAHVRAYNMITKFTNAKHDKLYIDFATNPKWAEIMKNLASEKEPTKFLEKLGNVIGRSSMAASMQDSNQP